MLALAAVILSTTVVYAAHLDQLPAAGAESASASGSSGGNLREYAAAGWAMLAVGLLAVIAGRRIRLKRRQA
jgi:hypothetical protein